MTKLEALLEARRRWGPYGAVKRMTWLRLAGYQVGEVLGAGWRRCFEPRGRGTSWELAFADADVERSREQLRDSGYSLRGAKR